MSVTYYPTPSNCDICDVAITTTFVDGKTVTGTWGKMCVKCYRVHGIGLGTGKGQMYQRQNDGSYLKING